MNYPTKEQVMGAGHYQLAVWYRHLPSPGQNYISSPDYDQKVEEEVKVMDLILRRFKEMGGWNPELSKLVGWK